MTSMRNGRRVAGFTLIELMVALVLGMIVTGAALTVFVTNRQTYRATESLDRIQENARTAFELMARDLREGGGNACGKTSLLTMTNVLNNPTSNWYTDWTAGLKGYDGNQTTPGLTSSSTSTPQNRVTGTDAIDLRSATSTNINVVPDLSGGSAEIKIASNTLALSTGDIVVICDPAHMAIFQVTGYNSANVTVGHNPGNNNPSPGNFRKELGSPPDTPLDYNFGCKNGDAGTYTDCATNPASQWPASIAKLQSSRWYIGYNDHNTRSLFHASLTNNGGTTAVRTDEIAEGVQDMQLEYLLDGATDYADASSISASDWASDKVVAVRITLTVTDSDKTGTDGNPITRNIEHTVTLRNRAP